MKSYNQIIIASSNTNSLPILRSADSLIPLIFNGGIAILIIIAMSYFTKVQLKSITDLLKKLNEK
ncbi:hypothetical protein CYANOKiyG1_60000 [Okeania sp. KiyG1]|nr:hypothetical protein CYANOKiyG1_60000 [Okeania sp. KiyG1]